MASDAKVDKILSQMNSSTGESNNGGKWPPSIDNRNVCYNQCIPCTAQYFTRLHREHKVLQTS